MLEHYKEYQFPFNYHRAAERARWRSENYYWFRFTFGIGILIYRGYERLKISEQGAAEMVGLPADAFDMLRKGFICLNVQDLKIIADIFNIKIFTDNEHILKLLDDNLSIKELARMDIDGINVFSKEVYNKSLVPASVAYIQKQELLNRNK